MTLTINFTSKNGLQLTEQIKLKKFKIKIFFPDCLKILSITMTFPNILS